MNTTASWKKKQKLLNLLQKKTKHKQNMSSSDLWFVRQNHSRNITIIY